MTAKIHSLSLQGLQATPVEIEVDIAQGLPSFIIVGLPDAAVSEARDRVRSAIKNSGFSFPRTRVTVNLAPACTKKAGSQFDVAIALGILMASGAIERCDAFCIGELALDGRVHGIRGALPLVYSAAESYSRPIIIPYSNRQEASLVQNTTIFLASSLADIVQHYTQGMSLPTVSPYTLSPSTAQSVTDGVDMKYIIGQYMAKRALTLAAAGGHNVCMIGPPGVGKSMLARALPSILPDMTQTEIIESTMIHSLTKTGSDIVTVRPFRAPHHSTSPVAILGGGPHLQPGEISLAHTGVLFLDELPEFRRDVIEALRQPLEDGTVSIHRAYGTVRYPAHCQVITAANPCPCGFFGVGQGRECTCSPYHIQQYRRKLSGPFMDRIDIKLSIPYVDVSEMKRAEHASMGNEESSAAIRQHVSAARGTQYARQGKINARLSKKMVEEVVHIDTQSQQLLHAAIEKQHLSMRGYIKTLKMSRTIADVEEKEEVEFAHIAEALQYTAGFLVE